MNRLNELNKEKEEKEEEVKSLNDKMKETSEHISSLHEHASMSVNGLSEDCVLREEERGEKLMKEMCSLRVRMDE